MSPSSRRQDHKLREAIDRLRQLLHTRPDRTELYHAALKEACLLFDAPYGLVTTCSEPTPSEWHVIAQFQTPSAKGANTIDTKGLAAARPIYESICLDTITTAFEQVKTSRAAATLTQMELYGLTNAVCQTLDWPSLTHAVILPIVDVSQIYGLLCLINLPTKYDASIAKRAWPLITTTLCLSRMTQDREETAEPFVNRLPAEEQQYQTMFYRLEQNCPMALIEIDQNMKVTRLNKAAETLLCFTNDKPIGQDIDTIIPERFPNEHKVTSFSLLPGSAEITKSSRYLAHTAKGQPIPVEIKSCVYARSGQPHRLLMLTDCSELDRIKQEQDIEIQRFKAVANLAPIGILQVDAKWELVYVNDRWHEIAQREADEISALNWISAFYHEDVEKVLEDLRQAMVQGREYNGLCRLQSPVGDIIWVELFARPLYNTKSEMSGFLSTMSDYTYRYHAEQRLRHLAERDPLTGLANRALFNDRLNQALARTKRGGSLALLSLDLDGFKNVNDNLGHDAGDQLLEQVANRLIGAVRISDTVARVGGDEFLVLLEDITEASMAAQLAEKILLRISEPFEVQRQEVFISGSVGIAFAVAGHDDIDAETVLKQVDMALYRAKEMGRNNYQYYCAELEVATKDRLFLGNSLHRALDRAEFRVFYQLQKNLITGDITGSEALLRWQHPTRGLLSPLDFISLLEETGLIVSVSHWLMKQAFTQHRNWVESGLLPKDSHIAINLSARQLRDHTVINQFKEALAQSGLEAEHVVLEITESVLLETTTTTTQVLHQLKSLGAKVALDDFGTGYSSLTYLKKFPIDCIKIDRSFVQNLLTDHEDAAITQGIIRLAQSLDLKVVAEGVDNSDKLSPLKAWGCNSYQGFLLNEPLPNHEAELLLNRDEPTEQAI